MNAQRGRIPISGHRLSFRAEKAIAVALLTPTSTLQRIPFNSMSGYKNFAIIGAGELGMYVVRQFLEEKAAGTIDEVVVLTRQVSPVRPLVVFFARVQTLTAY
jgi:glutamyl-tRNA reductase